MMLPLAEITMIETLLASLPAMACVFLGIALFVIGFFRPAPDADFDAAFRVSVDNLDRHTLFDIPELRPIIWPFHELARRMAFDKLRRRLLRNLRASGNPKAYSPDEYMTLCVLSGLTAVLATTVLWLLLLSGMPFVGLYPMVFVIGFWLCEYDLSSKAHKRLRQINFQLPYALDLLAMTMQAGATFYEAARTVANENSDEPLNQELATVVREIEFGRSRQDALQHFADRIPLQTLNSIIAAILQAEELGTPLADVLVLQANLLRMYRSMRAEKALGEATVKLLIPSMLIFLSVVLIIFGPVLVRYLTGELGF